MALCSSLIKTVTCQVFLVLEAHSFLVTYY